jgi:hypothetical protein
MIFEQEKTLEKYGEKAGYVFAYFLFTTVLFFVLTFFEKIPESWSYFTIMGITLIIVLIGVVIKSLLK